MSAAISRRARRLRDRLRWQRFERRSAGRRLLAAFAEAHPEAWFVEIGSNDGSQYDDLRPHILSGRWRGVMVEPVPYVFARLERSYGHLDGVALENVAIADREGRLPFHHLAEADPAELAELPSWYDAIGSFSRETVLRHREIPGIEDRLVVTEVPCETFEGLCRRNGIERIDLLAIDTEGSDAAILRQADIEARRPRLVVYEHYHLSAADRDGCRDRLAGLGYEILEEFLDTYALLPADDELTRVFRRLRPAMKARLAAEERGSLKP
ncbi:MAG TPA: FkbM family methyltransferase [Solirubrobacterales bacterium]